MAIRQAWRRAGRLWPIALVVIGLALPVSAQTRPFVMAADVEPQNMLFLWATLIYKEAFRRLGLPVEMVSLNLARRSALAEEGGIDGEVARIYSYGDTHPALIRIEEPVMEFTFSIFTGSTELQARQLSDLPAGTLIDYRRGILLCENALKKAIPAERLGTVTTTEQGIRKLLARRSDAYCDIDIYISEFVQSGKLNNNPAPRKLFDIATMKTYPYLARHHAELAPKLTAVLQQMRAEGLLVRYQKQAEQQLGR